MEGKGKMKGKGEDTTNMVSQSNNLSKGKVAPKQMPIVKKNSKQFETEEISLEDKEKEQLKKDKKKLKDDQSGGKIELSEKRPKIEKQKVNNDDSKSL